MPGQFFFGILLGTPITAIDWGWKKQSRSGFFSITIPYVYSSSGFDQSLEHRFNDPAENGRTDGHSGDFCCRNITGDWQEMIIHDRQRTICLKPRAACLPVNGLSRNNYLI